MPTPRNRLIRLLNVCHVERKSVDAAVARAGIGPQRWRKISDGRVEMQRRELYSVCAALGISIDFILSGRGPSKLTLTQTEEAQLARALVDARPQTKSSRR